MINLNEKFIIPKINKASTQTFTNPMGETGHPDPCIVYCEEEKCYYGISTNSECE